MKRTMIFVLGLFLVFALISPSTMAAKITLRYVDHNPETGISAQRATIPFLKQIEEATNNEVKIETYFGETLLKARDTWDGLRNGIADIGWFVLSYWPGLTPMTDAFGVPGLEFESPMEAGGAIWRAYEKYPEMQAEYLKGGIRPLIFFATEPYFIATTKKPVANINDIKGLKLRTLGGIATTQMRALGAVPLAFPMPDNYIALQKGTIDGLGISNEATTIWRLYEILNYYNDAPCPLCYFVMPISEKKWQSLPKDIQDQIMSVCGYEGSRWYSDNYFGYFVDQMPKIAEENGYKMNLVQLTPEARQEWIDASEPCFTEYYALADKKGVGEAARALVKDLQAGNIK